MKVAMSSDNHFDINRVDADEMLKEQAEYLVSQHVSYYLIAGDLFNDFTRTLAYVQKLASELQGKTIVRFIAGNHDMLKGVTYEELESQISVEYLHNQFEDLPCTNWRIVGNNGWYDYSLARFADNIETKDIELWKRAYWVDRAIQQPMNDYERMEIVLKQVKSQLDLARQEQKRVLFMTHFVPRREYVQDRPDKRMWDMFNAMLGSERLGQVLNDPAVKHVLFGHLHIHPKVEQLNHAWYYNRSVGYKSNHINEWVADDFFSQWQARLAIIDLEK